MSEPADMRSPSEEVETESLPEASASASDPPTTPPDTWLSDMDGSRWIDARDEAALNMWGSPMAANQPPAFDPSSAFEPAGSGGGGEDSDSNRSDDGWQGKRQALASAPKRLKSEGSPGPDIAKLPSTTETGTTGEEAMDDEERSSGEFQGTEMDQEDQDVIRALGPGNVQRLASMHAADLADLAEDSGEEGGVDDDSYDDSSDPESLDATPALVSCTNCTHDFEPGQTTCPECGHDNLDDIHLFSGLRHRLEPARQSTVLAFDERMLEHEEGRRFPHPERPDRIRAVIARLMATGLADRCLRIPCREARTDELTACHSQQLVAKVEAMSETASASGREIGVDRTYFTSDTYVRPATSRCARLAAGGCIEVATAVARGEVTNGAAVVRPPGHHAESGMAMGFCFFNNAAVAARAAQRAGAGKVLILDWDVHHGNGTQHIFEHDPSILYMSIHRWDGGFFFPGTGGPHEVGKGPGEGYSVNVPWPRGGMGNGDYLCVFQHLVLPIAYEFAPDIIIVSAGFDAAEGDPLGGCYVTPEGYAHMTAQLQAVAPLAVLLEGGYNLKATALGTEASLRVLLGEQAPPLPHAGHIDACVPSVIQRVVDHQAKYWRCLRPFLERLSFDPYASPFAEAAPLSPTMRGRESSSPRAGPPDNALLVHRGGLPLPARSQDVARALNRSKLQARRHQGKSQRRLQYMHALHLVVLRHKMKAAKAVSQKLAAVKGLARLGSSPRALPSPGRRPSLKSPLDLKAVAGEDV